MARRTRRTGAQKQYNRNMQMATMAGRGGLRSMPMMQTDIEDSPNPAAWGGPLSGLSVGPTTAGGGATTFSPNQVMPGATLPGRGSYNGGLPFGGGNAYNPVTGGGFGSIGNPQAWQSGGQPIDYDPQDIFGGGGGWGSPPQSPINVSVPGPGVIGSILGGVNGGINGSILPSIYQVLSGAGLRPNGPNGSWQLPPGATPPTVGPNGVIQRGQPTGTGPQGGASTTGAPTPGTAQFPTPGPNGSVGPIASGVNLPGAGTPNATATGGPNGATQNTGGSTMWDIIFGQAQNGSNNAGTQPPFGNQPPGEVSTTGPTQPLPDNPDWGNPQTVPNPSNNGGWPDIFGDLIDIFTGRGDQPGSNAQSFAQGGWSGVTGSGNSAIDQIINTGMSDYAIDAWRDANRDAARDTRQMYNDQIDRLNPFVQAGLGNTGFSPMGDDAIDRATSRPDLINMGEVIFNRDDLEPGDRAMNDLNPYDAGFQEFAPGDRNVGLHTPGVLAWLNQRTGSDFSTGNLDTTTPSSDLQSALGPMNLQAGDRTVMRANALDTSQGFPGLQAGDINMRAMQPFGGQGLPGMDAGARGMRGMHSLSSHMGALPAMREGTRGVGNALRSNLPSAGRVDVNQMNPFDSNDPALQFLQDEQRKAIEKSAAARGKLNSGGTMKALQDRAANVALARAGDIQNIMGQRDRLDLGADAQRFGQQGQNQQRLFDQSIGAGQFNNQLNQQQLSNAMAKRGQLVGEQSQDFGQRMGANDFTNRLNQQDMMNGLAQRGQLTNEQAQAFGQTIAGNQFNNQLNQQQLQNAQQNRGILTGEQQQRFNQLQDNNQLNNMLNQQDLMNQMGLRGMQSNEFGQQFGMGMQGNQFNNMLNQQQLANMMGVRGQLADEFGQQFGMQSQNAGMNNMLNQQDLTNQFGIAGQQRQNQQQGFSQGLAGNQFNNMLNQQDFNNALQANNQRYQQAYDVNQQRLFGEQQQMNQLMSLLGLGGNAAANQGQNTAAMANQLSTLGQQAGNAGMMGAFNMGSGISNLLGGLFNF